MKILRLLAVLGMLSGCLFAQHTEDTLEDAQTITGAKTFTGTTTSSNLNGAIFVDGTKYPKTCAGIQSAVTDAASGGHIHLSGTYTCSGSGSELILITKSLLIDGDGVDAVGGGTVLQVANTVPGTTDIIHVQAPSLIQGITLRDFQIIPASGTPGRYGIHLDAGTSGIGDIVISNIRINTLGNYALYADNPNNLNSSVYLMSVKDCKFFGGVSLSGTADSLLFEGNNITGVRDFTVNMIGAVAHTDGGAHGLEIVFNNLTPVGGIVIQNAWQGMFAWNDIEATATSTEANNAMIDLQGNATSPIQEFQVIGNYLGGNASFVATTLRIDRMVHTVIRDNFMTQASSNAAVVTANADRTMFLQNRHAPDNVLSSWLSNSGTNTIVDEFNQSTGMRTMAMGNSSALAFSGLTGTNGVAISNTQVKVGNTSGLFCFSNGDPTANGCRTGISELAAAAFGFGNGTVADVSAQLIASAYGSGTANRANSGFIRAASTDQFSWRNNANTADLAYGKNSSDIRTWAGVPLTLNVASDFTLAANTSLQTITGLTFTLPANAALIVNFSCHLMYSQATAAVADQFGIQSATISPTNIAAKAQAYTSTSAFTAGNLPTLATSTATAIVTFTPTATATVFNADIDGLIENPSNASANVINIMAQTSNSADLVTVKRGSFCRVF